MAAAWLKDIPAHFLPCHKSWAWYRRTRRMVRLGREVQSQMDYLLGTERRLYQKVSFQEPWHKWGHYMILGCLCSATLREHYQYLKQRMRLPSHPPDMPTGEDCIFAELRQEAPKLMPQEARCNAWILAATWILVDTIFSVHQEPVW